MAVKTVLRTFLLVNVALMASAAVLPRAGTQFITGACASDNDCATSCCGFKSGKCAAAVVAQERDGGCGFGDVAPNNLATLALGSKEAAAGVDNSKAGQRAAGGAAAAAPAAPANDVAAAPAAPAAGAARTPGTQFITGACTADTDCGSLCCGFKSGKCAAAVVAQERDGGCGFGDVAPNNLATLALGASAAAAGVDNSKAGQRAAGGAAAAAPAAPAAPDAGAAAAPAAPATGSGKAPGTQFITGECANDGECASTCCSVGKCAARLVATGPGGKGCGFGGAAAASPAAAAPAAPAAPAAGSGKAAGTQFITGACANDGECASTCCSVGKCAARLVATGPGGKGCGFGGAAARRMTRSMKMNRLD